MTDGTTGGEPKLRQHRINSRSSYKGKQSQDYPTGRVWLIRSVPSHGVNPPESFWGLIDRRFQN